MKVDYTLDSSKFIGSVLLIAQMKKDCREQKNVKQNFCLIKEIIIAFYIL